MAAVAAAWKNCGTEFCSIEQRDLEACSIKVELSVLESQIQGLHEKHSQLCEQKTMLETSRVEDTLREHRSQSQSQKVKVCFIVNSATCTVHTYRELKFRYSLTPWRIQITLNTNSRTQKYR